MIQNWLEIIGVLVAILVGLIGAFWKLITKASENKKQYENDLEATRSVVTSRDFIPEIAALIEKAVKEKENSPSLTLEEILGSLKSTIAYPLRRVVLPLRPLNELEGLYLKTIDRAFDCAYDMLGIAVLPAIAIIWVFVDLYWEYFLPIISFAGVVILIKTILDVLNYTRTLRQFMRRDTEIRMGRSVS